jgi:hypothetical protein
LASRIFVLNLQGYKHTPHFYPRKKAAHLVVKILKALNTPLLRKLKPLPEYQEDSHEKTR